MTTATLSPAAADALRGATADDTSIRLNCGQLDRKVYVEVNKALERIAGGGKWNRQKRAHLYTQDPRPELAALVGDGESDVAMPVDRDKEASFWRTPDAIVDRMLTLAGFDDRLPMLADVLEPSAGDGAIADAIRRARPDLRLTCVEADPTRGTALVLAGHAVEGMRFEEFASMTSYRFDAIVMNPPFTVPGDSKAWATHVGLALDLLAPGGVLVAVVPVSYTTAQTKRVLALIERVEVQFDGEWVPLPEDAFKASGTAVRTGLIVARAAR